MKAVLFDLGRVLIDYDHAATLRGLSELAGCSGEEMAARFGAIRRDLEIGQMESEQLLAWLRAQPTARTASFDDLFHAFTSGMARDDDALAYALELEARPDLLVAALSNTNETHIRWLDEQVPELRQFDLVMFSSEIGMGKPDPAVFRLALELLDLHPSHALLVDDSSENVRAAESVGMAGIVHENWARTRPLLESWING